MRKPALVLATILATALPCLALTDPAGAAPPRPMAELVTKAVSDSLAAGTVSATGTVKNNGTKSAKASAADFYLSPDAKHSSDDVRLGSASIKKIKPKQSATASGTFAVPATLPAGSYHVVICADAHGQVKERKETNNCKGSTGTVTVGAGGGGGGGGGGTPTGPVTVSATAGTGGSVATSAVTGGSCAALTCTFPTAGTGTVTFTPTPAAGYRFGAWGGATCSGYTTAAAGKITFTNPTTAHACTATFVKQVTISYTLNPPLFVAGTVTSAASNGACSGSDPVSGAGSCLVDAGVGTVTFTAASSGLFAFIGWSGATCVGNVGPTIATLNVTAPTTDEACVATFG
jgi:hypothetical protein